MGEVRNRLVVALTKVNLGTSNLTLRIGTLVDHNVDAVIFHCRVKIFFHGFGYAVNLVDKKKVSFLQIGKQSCDLQVCQSPVPKYLTSL